MASKPLLSLSTTLWSQKQMKSHLWQFQKLSAGPGPPLVCSRSVMLYRPLVKNSTENPAFVSKCFVSSEFLFVASIHRMQIWRTTPSAPGTSSMKVRLVRPRCFVFTMLPLKSLASSRWSSLVYFAMPTSF